MSRLFYLSSVILGIYLCLIAADDLQLKLTNSNNQLGNKLYKIFTENNTKDNTLFSPLSLHSALSLLYLGSLGETQKDMSTALDLPDPKTTAITYKALLRNLRSTKKITIEVATKLFVSTLYKLDGQFKCLAAKYYYAEEEIINFEKVDDAVTVINNWVSRKTRNRIKEIANPTMFTGASTALILINAVYFKGDWQKPFEESSGRQKFYVSEEKTVECELMTIATVLDCFESEELDASVFRLPYENNNFSLIIVLPNQKMGYVALEKQLQERDLFAAPAWDKKYIRVFVPKFRIEETISLREPLTALGLERVFTSGEFQNITGSSLEVTDIIQKLFINVDETGTEAGAVSHGSLQPKVVSPKHIFKADHPFLFFLEYSTSRSSHILFQGRVRQV